MCGRYVIYNKITGGPIKLLGHDIPANYNIAPTSINPIIRLDENRKPELIMARWGLLPVWAKNTKIKPFFNARADNLPGNKVFWESRDRHCLVPMSGFYEWSQHDKQPYYIYPEHNELIYVAGLWRRWQKDNEFIDSYCIITTTPHPTLKDIHHRSPVILQHENKVQWLNSDYEMGKNLLSVYTGHLIKHAVDKKVNSGRANGADLIQKIHHS